MSKENNNILVIAGILFLIYFLFGCAVYKPYSNIVYLDKVVPCEFEQGNCIQTFVWPEFISYGPIFRENEKEVYYWNKNFELVYRNKCNECEVKSERIK